MPENLWLEQPMIDRLAKQDTRAKYQGQAGSSMGGQLVQCGGVSDKPPYVKGRFSGRGHVVLSSPLPLKCNF